MAVPAAAVELARSLPKVLLHDHLDGGLRVDTILELAAEAGHELPSTDPTELVAYFRAGADARDILQYLDTFAHTVPLLQRADALRRVARECAEDLAADGVAYAEVRFAPELHPGAGSLDDAIAAVTGGFDEAVAAGADIVVNTIVCAMRTEARSLEVAEACVRNLATDGRPGVVAFDLAGAETGFPPSEHRDAVDVALAGGARLTIHASEPPGLELIADALACGAERVGHGVRLIEDCTVGADGELTLGPLAVEVRDRAIPLELCPSCNVQIGAVPTLADHPIGPFLRAGLVATVNTDNRLMSGVSASSELAAVIDTFGLDHTEIARLLHNGVAASFATEDVKAMLRRRIDEATARPGSRAD